MVVVDLTGLVDGLAMRIGHGWIGLTAKREPWDDSQVWPSWMIQSFTERGR